MRPFNALLNNRLQPFALYQQCQNKREVVAIQRQKQERMQQEAQFNPLPKGDNNSRERPAAHKRPSETLQHL